MRRSPLPFPIVAALLAGLTLAACSRKETPAATEPAAAEDPGSADGSEAHTPPPEEPAAETPGVQGRKAALAEKAREREAARKAAREARKARGTAEEAPAAGDGATGPGTEEAPAVGAAPSAARALQAPPTDEPAAPPTPPVPTPDAPAASDAGPTGAEFVVRDDNPLDLSKLVTLADVQKVMKKSPLQHAEPLAGSLAARDYNGVRFYAGKNETLGVAVQVWRSSTTIDARRRYDVFSSHYPNAETTDAVATQGFFAHSGDVLYLGFLDQAKKAVVIASCSEDACDMKDLYVLARDLQKKL